MLLRNIIALALSGTALASCGKPYLSRGLWAADCVDEDNGVEFLFVNAHISASKRPTTDFYETYVQQRSVKPFANSSKKPLKSLDRRAQTAPLAEADVTESGRGNPFSDTNAVPAAGQDESDDPAGDANAPEVATPADSEITTPSEVPKPKSILGKIWSSTTKPAAKVAGAGITVGGLVLTALSFRVNIAAYGVSVKSYGLQGTALQLGQELKKNSDEALGISRHMEDNSDDSLDISRQMLAAAGKPPIDVGKPVCIFETAMICVDGNIELIPSAEIVMKAIAQCYNAGKCSSCESRIVPLADSACTATKTCRTHEDYYCVGRHAEKCNRKPDTCTVRGYDTQHDTVSPKTSKPKTQKTTAGDTTVDETAQVKNAPTEDITSDSPSQDTSTAIDDTATSKTAVKSDATPGDSWAADPGTAPAVNEYVPPYGRRPETSATSKTAVKSKAAPVDSEADNSGTAPAVNNYVPPYGRRPKTPATSKTAVKSNAPPQVDSAGTDSGAAPTINKDVPPSVRKPKTQPSRANAKSRTNAKAKGSLRSSGITKDF